MLNFRFLILIAFVIIVAALGYTYIRKTKDPSLPKDNLKLMNREVDKKYKEIEIENVADFFDKERSENAVRDYLFATAALAETDLVNLDCTAVYTSKHNAFSENPHYFDFSPFHQNPPRREAIELTDSILLDFIDFQNNKWQETDKEQRVGAIARCTTDTEKQLIFYDKAYKNNLINTQGLISGFLNDNKVTNEIEITQGTSLFTCVNIPIAYTKNDIAYFKCNTADGLVGVTTLYKANYRNRTTVEILECLVSRDVDGTDSYSCKIPMY